MSLKVKSKPKDDPVKIILTEEKKASITKEVQTYALAKEKEFEDLTNLLMENKYFDNIKELERVDAERKARSARARKTEEQKELEAEKQRLREIQPALNRAEELGYPNMQLLKTKTKKEIFDIMTIWKATEGK